MELTKIQIKLIHPDDTVTWSHFCYANAEVKDKFDRYVNNPNLMSNHWISTWAYQQFELLDIDTPDGLQKLKEAIKNKYKEKYPELYMNTNTDKQGWLRVWYVENMEMELKSVGH